MILMKLGKINGVSKIADHIQWVQIDSLQFGVGRAVSSVGGGADRETSDPSFSEVTATKSMEISSPDIYFEAIAGKAPDKCEIHFVNTQGTDQALQVYLEMILYEPLITGYSMSSAGDRPSESFSLNFTKIEYLYHSYSGKQKKTGTTKNWDLVTNQKY